MGRDKKIKIGFRFQVSGFKFKCLAFFFGVCFALLFSVGLALPLVGQAAELKLLSATNELGVGQKFQIDLMLNTEGRAINAIEGTLTFPSLVELVGVYDGSSVVPLWLEKSVKADSVDFSGVIPGGFNGILVPYQEDRPEPGKILSFIFITRVAGEGSINLKNVQALLNDGQGTPAKTAIFNFQFSIAEETPGFDFSAPGFKDTEPPEEFTPEVSRDPNIFDGQWFLVFATQDKDSGIDHYEVQEGKKGFVVGQSPYLLTNQELTDKITVKAVDKAGNERIAVLPPQNPFSWYKNYWFWGIIVLVLLVSLFFLKNKCSKLKK
ncbi:MAG: hypothetical protein AAB358_00860 [Patescibacteria group bacterium]